LACAPGALAPVHAVPGEDVSLPEALFPGLSEKPDLYTLGIAAIARAYGMLLGKAVERIALSAASAAASAAFNIAQDAPILALDRIVENHSGQPAEWRVAECMTSVMRYEVESS
jgi:GntR family transcriptional regulator